MLHPVVVVGPALMMVAKAVAALPVCTQRLDGRTAATSGEGTQAWSWISKSNTPLGVPA